MSQPEDPGGMPSWQREQFGERLARIDERTQNTATKVAEIARDIGELRGEIVRDETEMRKWSQTEFVNRSDFSNISDKVKLHERILFTVIGLICIAVIYAVLALVLRHAS